MRLTDDERDTLLGHIGAWRWERQGLEAAEANFYAAVEAILTARLAAVEALAERISGDEGVVHNEGCRGERDCLACIVLDLYRIAALTPEATP